MLKLLWIIKDIKFVCYRKSQRKWKEGIEMKRLLMGALVLLFLCLTPGAVFAEGESYTPSTGDYLSEQEAKCFIGFLFNTNDLTDEQLNQNGMFKLLTGKLTGNEEEQAGVQFIQFMNTRLTSQVGNLEGIVDNSSQFLVDYLSTKANGDLASDIINETLHGISNQFFDFMQEEYLISGNGMQDMEYEFFQNGMLAWDSIQQINGISGKVEEYKNQILALSNATFYVAGSNRVEMYKYFLMYRNNLNVKYTIGEDAFQFIIDGNLLLNEKMKIIMALQPKLENFPFFDDNILSWATEDRMAMMERWADYVYQLENRIKTKAASAENQEITQEPSTQPTSVHYKVIDESCLSYDVTTDGAVITGYTGSYSYAMIPNKIAGYRVVGIGDNAFKENPWLRYVYMPGSVRSIGNNAFLNCSGLQKVIIPNGDVAIGERAFGFYREATINGIDYKLDKGLGTVLCSASNSNVQNYAEASGNIFESTDWDGKTLTVVYPVGDTYYANTPAELAWIAEQSTSNDFYGKHLVISGTLDFNKKNWTPIGTYDKAFMGSIEIVDCDINGFYCDRFSGGYYNQISSGLFSNVSTKEIFISNLNINNAKVVTTGYQKVISGILFGRLNILNDGCFTIQNSCFTGKTQNYQGTNGGLIGALYIDNSAQTTFEQVKIDLEIGGQIDYLDSMDVGGLIAYVENRGKFSILQCESTGTFTAIGGRNTVGQCHPGTVGGLIGQLYNYNSLNMNQIFTNFTATTESGSYGQDYIGSLIAEIHHCGNISILNTCNIINYVSGSFNGFIGCFNHKDDMTIGNSLLINIGKATSSDYDRNIYSNVNCDNVYFANDKFSYQGTDRFVQNSRTDAEMKNQATYENWDFENIWCMGTDGYPVLLNQLENRNHYTVQAQALEGGSISSYGTLNYVEGLSPTYTIVPDSIYDIDQVIVDGVNHGSLSTYTFNGISSNHTIVATFKFKPSNPIIYKLDDGTLPDSAAQIYYEGVGLNSLAYPSKSGYSFCGWFDNAEYKGNRVTNISKEERGAKTLYAKWLPTIERPNVLARTDTTITLEENSNTLVSLDGVKWMPSGKIENLQPGMYYDITCRRSYTGDEDDQRDAIFVTTKQSAPQAPEKPSINIMEDEYITVPVNTALAYKIYPKGADANQYEWRTTSDGKLDGLTANTEYCLIVYYPETDFQMPSAVSPVLDFKTLKKAIGRPYGKSLSLEGKVDINYYTELDASIHPETISMKFWKEGDEENKTEVAYDPQNFTVVDGKTYYRFSYSVAAKEMTDTIKAQYYINGAETDDRVYDYAVQTYAGNQLNSATDENLKALLRSMLNYGARAQTHFNYQTDKMANSILSADEQQVPEAVLEELFNGSITSGTIVQPKAAFYGNSLILESQTYLRYYITVEDGVNADNLRLSVKKQGVPTAQELSLVHYKDNIYYATLEDIAAKNLKDMYEATVTENGAVVSETQTYGPMTYAKNKLADGSDANLSALMHAMIDYCDKAKAYFNI